MTIKWIDGLANESTGTIGPYRIITFGNGSWGSWGIRVSDRVKLAASLPETRDNPPTLDAAKADVESTLRDMRDALNEHFAPVLRWTSFGALDEAKIAGLTLQVTEHGWRVFFTRTDKTLDAAWSTGRDAGRAAAAACASEALGVVFRTEGE